MHLLTILPLACFTALAVLFVGWNWLDWKTTSVLPWSIWVLVLFLCSVSWRSTMTPWLKKLNAGLFALAFVAGILLISGTAEITILWGFFVFAGFTSVHLYLYDLARNSAFFKGVFAYLLLIPILLTAYTVAMLYINNGSLGLAWLGLILAILFAMTGLLVGYRKPKF